MNISATNRAITLILLVCGTIGCGGSPTAPPPQKPVNVPPGIGTPDGTPATGQIDAAGGTLTSTDGRLTLVVPAGVLTTPTQLTIQPITDTAPNGLQDAYRLEPEGTTFSSPVTVTFHLNTNEAMALATTFVASQHADRFWYREPGQSRDALNQTVSIATTHFSDWATATTLYLKPPSQRLQVNGQTDLEPFVVEEFDGPNGTAKIVAGPLPTFPGETDSHWAVNGIEGGNNGIGTIDALGRFTAPTGVAPGGLEVTVSLEVDIKGAKVVAVATIDIYNQQRWDGTSSITFIDSTRITANWTFVQDGETVEGDALYQFKVLNGLVTVIPPPPPDGCTLTIAPLTYPMAETDGSMTAEYNLVGPDNPMITGGGSTVWPADYTTVCDGMTQTIHSAVNGAWWPVVGPSVPVEASNEAVDIPISTPNATGTVHLHRTQ